MFKKINNRLQSILSGIWLNPIWITEYKLKTSLRSIIELAKISKNKKWLDVGTGSGGILDALDKLAGTIVSVEPKKIFRDRAQFA